MKMKLKKKKSFGKKRITLIERKKKQIFCFTFGYNYYDYLLTTQQNHLTLSLVAYGNETV